MLWHLFALLCLPLVLEGLPAWQNSLQGLQSPASPRCWLLQLQVRLRHLTLPVHRWRLPGRHSQLQGLLLLHTPRLVPVSGSKAACCCC